MIVLGDHKLSQRRLVIRQPLTAGLIHDKHIAFRGVSAYSPDSEGAVIGSLGEDQHEREIVLDDCTYREGALSNYCRRKSERVCKKE